MAWTQPKDLKVQVQKLWDKGMLLRVQLDESLTFPLRLQLKTPSSRELATEFQAAREWARELRDTKHIRLEYRTFRHPTLGENTIPHTAWLDSLEEAIHILRNRAEFEVFATLTAQTLDCNPSLLNWVHKKPLKALALAQQWPKFLAVVSYLKNNPRPGIYIRQLSIPGIDSKFIERHRAVLTSLLDLSLPPGSIDVSASGVKGFEQRFGFQAKPATVRFRILDERVSLLPGKDADICITNIDFRDLQKHALFSRHIQRVFITENEVNFLAFPAVENALVIFGAGYGFEGLKHIDWLARCEIIYWGDIDTHGFAILSQFRHSYPKTKSFLMDEATLLDHRPHWGHENSPEHRQLANLNTPEQDLYQDLHNNRFGEQLRLEQEKVDYNYLLERLL